MRLIVAGGRDYQHLDEDWTRLLSICKTWNVDTIISGHARGADAWGETFARRNGLALEIYPADWDRFGKSAGYRRNEQMARVADAVFLLPGGRGTAHMLEISKRRGLRVFQ